MISDDEEEEDSAEHSTAPIKRTPDQGDFDVNDDKAITGYFNINLKGSSITDKQKESLVKKVVTIWSTANPNYHKAKLGTNFTGTNKLGRLIANAVKNDTSLYKGLHAQLDKHIANHNSTIKDLEGSIGDLIKTQQTQRDTAAAAKANKKATPKSTPGTPVTASTTTNTSTPANTYILLHQSR